MAQPGHELVQVADTSRFTALATQLLLVADAITVNGVSEVRWPAVAELALKSIPQACHLDISEAQPGRRFHVVAADPGYPSALDSIRATAGQGPCFDALDHDVPAIGDDLATDARWPAYGPRIVDDTGMRSAMSYRIRLPDTRPGVLTFYSDWPYGFDDLAVTAAGLFAAFCTLAGAAGTVGGNTGAGEADSRTA